MFRGLYSVSHHVLVVYNYKNQVAVWSANKQQNTHDYIPQADITGFPT